MGIQDDLDGGQILYLLDKEEGGEGPSWQILQLGHRFISRKQTAEELQEVKLGTSLPCWDDSPGEVNIHYDLENHILEQDMGNS